MSVCRANTFIRRAVRDTGLRTRLNRATDDRALRAVLESEGLAFERTEFEEALRSLLRGCDSRDEASELRDVGLWWAVLTHR